MNYKLNSNLIALNGLPENASPSSVNLLKSRIDSALLKFCEENSIVDSHLNILFSNEVNDKNNDTINEQQSKQKENNYYSQKPLYDFKQLILPEYVKNELITAVELINFQEKVFVEWGLSLIEPNPRVALNFHGEPGTGKTLAAHAIASRIGCNIMIASYANIESMYHGEGPKNVVALFNAATKDNALLFIDEADSLLSKRLTNVTHGSEQAINSMRSQLLICLENFKGVVIFATNLVTNYDKAFETRVKNIYFPLPDFDCRKQIWDKHLVDKLPLSNDVELEKLAQIEDICGRDIKNAVIQAAINICYKGKEHISFVDLEDSIKSIKNARIKHDIESERSLTKEEILSFNKIDLNNLSSNSNK